MAANLFISNFNKILCMLITVKIIKRSIIFLIILIISDQFIGLILSRLFISQKTGHEQSLNYVFSECKADVLFFGNSRAQHHYDPRIISDSLHMTCYNSGMDGGHSVVMADAQIQVILKRHSPKIILLELSSSSFLGGVKNDYARLSILRPYYKTFPEIRPFVELIGPYEKYKLLSGIYPFNSRVIDIIRFNTNIDDNRKWIFDGYIPIKVRVMDKSMISTKEAIPDDAEIDTIKVKSFKNIVSLCERKRIKLILSISPKFNSDYSDNHKLTQPQKEFYKIADEHHLLILDFYKDKRFIHNMKLFADPSHMNEYGAAKYSSIVGGELKRIIKNK